MIAIVGILSGILLPLFLQCKRQARKNQCVSNLHQLGKAFSLYLSDWNGIYPSPGGKIGDSNYWNQSGNGGIVGYLKSSGGIGTVWCCPELTEWQGKYAARTYSMNSYLRNPPDVDYPSSCSIFKGCPEVFIEDTRRTILLYEGMPVTQMWPEGMDYIYRCGNWTCVRGWYTLKMPCLHTLNSWKPWHQGQNNYLYIDGHVRSFKPNKYPNRPPFDITNEWWVRKSVQAEKYKGW